MLLYTVAPSFDFAGNMDTRIYSLLIGLLVLIPLLSGCGTMGARPDKGPQDPLAMADDLLPEAKLLDLWIEVLEARPLSEEQQESHGIRPEIREAESRFISVHLKNTLQKSGYWGAVRVVPKGTNGGEVIVRGEILESDGEKLVVRIQASDSRGHTWLDKTYQGGVEGEDYEKAARSEEDPFQHVYNAIANDLIRHKEGLAPDTLVDIRRIAELRFAAEFAPDAFGDYLTSSGGAYSIRRLPAEQDPMLLRIRGIRERDYMLIDTVNDHYDGYYRDLQDSYDNWRKFRQEEAENLRQLS